MQDRVEKQIELNAPVARVWRALTDPAEFGEWFRVAMETGFVVGEMARGKTTFPGYEGMKWEVKVEAMEPERLFSFTWCPYEHDDNPDERAAERTLVEFRLEPVGGGTRVTVTESGFDRLPDDPRRGDALRSNAEGWKMQLDSLASYATA